MKYCGKCGSSLQDEDKFCINCGNQILSPNEEIKPGSALPTATRQTNSGSKTKIIISLLLALIILTGGYWGWSSLGSDGRAASKLDLAVKYVSEKNYEQAVLAYNEVIKIKPKEVKAYQGLGRVYTLQGQNDKAQTAYEQGLKAVPAADAERLNLALAAMYIDGDDLAAAEKVYQEIIARNPALTESYRGLAYVYQQKGDASQGIAILQKAIRLNSQDYSLANSLAQFYSGSGVYAQATDILFRSIAINPDQSEAYIMLNSLYNADWPGLQQEAAKQTDPALAAMIDFYGLYQSGKYPDALAVFDKQLKTQTNNQKAKMLAASCYIRTGNSLQAQSLVNEVAAAPSNQWIMNDLARFYLKNQDMSKAKEWAQNSFNVGEGNIEAVEILKQCDLAQNEIDLYLARLMIESSKALRVLNQEIALSDIEGLLVSPLLGNRISLYGVNLGDTYDNVITRLGRPQDTQYNNVGKKDNKVGDLLVYPWGDLGISHFSNRVLFVALRNSNGITSEGIRVGDPLSRVVEAYGNNYVDSAHTEDNNRYKFQRIYTFSNGMLAFDFDSDVVKEVRLFRTQIQRQYIP